MKNHLNTTSAPVDLPPIPAAFSRLQDDLNYLGTRVDDLFRAFAPVLGPVEPVAVEEVPEGNSPFEEHINSIRRSLMAISAAVNSLHRRNQL